MTAIPFSAPNFQQLSTHTELANFREDCWTAFSKKGLPTRKQEAWKYTDLSRLVKASSYADTYHPTTSPVVESTGYTLHLVDGWFDTTHSQVPNGVVIEAFSSWQKNNPQAAIALLSGIDHQQHPMVEANAALVTDGLVISIPDNLVINDPMTVVYHCTQSNSAQHYRHHLVLGENSRITLIEQSAHVQESWMNNMMHMHLAAYAYCEHVQQFCHTPNMTWLANTQVWQQANSEYHYFALAKDCQLSRADVQIYLQGPHAKCWMDGVYQLDNHSHFDIHTRVDHLANDTYSDELFKGVVTDQARGVFNGKAVAHHGTQRIQAYQRNHNLLLAPTAHVDTKPELEIYTDDIRCTHGATVGHLDESALFYLRSRGISKAQAITLLKEAFLHEGFSRLSDLLKEQLSMEAQA